MDLNINWGLAPLDRTDCEQLRAWRNNYAIWRWCRQQDLISDVDQAAWFERQAKDPSTKMYKVQVGLNDNKTTVGVCGLTSIDFINRRAEFSLYIAPEHQRRGFGKQALETLLDHAFFNLNLLQVWGEVFAGNPAMEMFEKLGFSKDGTRKKFYFKDGKYLDAHLISIFEETWRGRRKPSARSVESIDNSDITNGHPGSTMDQNTI